MKAASYAAIVANFLSQAERQRLTQAASALDTALEGPEEAWDEAIAAYRRVFTEIRDGFLAAAVPVPELLAEARRAAERGTVGSAEARIGPLLIGFTSPTATLRGPSGPPIVLGPLPPDGFRAALDTGPVRASGSLVREPARIAGSLGATFGAVRVGALGSLTLPPAPPSFLATLSAGFTPGLQLGFGFQIARIGGVIAVNRSIDAGALAERLKGGAASDLLFPADAGPAARRALDAAEVIFPLCSGCAVVGPTARLSWLEVAGTGFASVDAAILIALPGPRIAIVGAFRATVPGTTALVRLRADVAGTLDLPAERAGLDASLYDSGVLGIFTIYGDLTFAASWGAQPYVVLSLGGFYPGWRPEPVRIRPLSRLGMALDFPLPGLRVRAEGYLAATDNTLQLGGRLEVGIDAGIASATGHLGADALVQFTPFRFKAEVCAGLDVRFLGKTFGGVRFDGAMEGPGPVTLRGRLTVETFIRDFRWSDTFVFGGPEPRLEPPGRRAVTILVQEAFRPLNIRADRGTDPSVALSSPDRISDHAVVPPLGTVSWSQQRVPLGIDIDRVDGTPLGSTQRVSARTTRPSAELRLRFAPGSFITLSAAQMLASPAYDMLPAGLTVGAGDPANGPDMAANETPRVLRKVRGEAKPLEAATAFALAFAAGPLAMVGTRDRSPAVAEAAAGVVERPQGWVTLRDGAHHLTVTEAMGAGARGAGPALAVSDKARPIALEGV